MKRDMKQAMKGVLRFIEGEVLRINALWLVRLIYGDFWTFRKKLKVQTSPAWWKRCLYYKYLEHFGAWIGLGAIFDGDPVLPHGLSGIFISHSAKLGKGCVLFQRVTIGSNMLKDARIVGSPTLGDNVYVGAGASLIGGVHIGDNVRIGANCPVAKDVPANSTVVIGDVKIISSPIKLDNQWIENKQ